MKKFDLKHQELNKIKKEAEKTSFFDRMQPFILIIKILLLPALITWSVITEVTFLGTQFYGNTKSLFVTIALTIILVGVIEISKLSIGSVFIKLFTHRHIAEGWHYILFALPLFLWFLLSFGSSAYLSIQGAKYTAENIKDMQTYTPTINIDSINTIYNQKFKTIQGNINSSKKTTWKGRVTSDAMRSINKYQSQIVLLEKARQNEILQAREENKNKLLKTETKTKDWGTWLSRIGGFSEILTIIVLIILTLFTYISMQELELKSEKPIFKKITGNKNQTKLAPQIGFKIPKKTIPKQKETIVSSSVSETVSNPQNTVEQRHTVVSETVSNSVSKKNKQFETKTKVIKFDRSRCEKYARIYFKRSIESKSEVARNSNKIRYENNKKELEYHGIKVIEKGKTLIFKES